MINKNTKTITQIKKVYQYSFFDKFICGIVLKGWEVKSIRLGQVHINNAYVVAIEKELFVKEMHISLYNQAFFPFCDIKNEQKRKIKILLSKKEILKIIEKTKTKGYITVINKILIINGWIKLEICLVKHLKKYQIKSKEKEKEIKKKLQNLQKYG